MDSRSDAVDGELRRLAALVGERRRKRPGQPVRVGIAGAVSVGKSTLASALASRLSEEHAFAVTVIGTDGFLLPNSVLEPLGRAAFKGFPDTYDTPALRRFLELVSTGATHATVPEYSHVVFDIIGTHTIALAPDVVIVEGINILGHAYRGALDLRIFLDAAEADIIDWYVARFVGLIAAAEHDATSFYTRFVPLDPDGRAAMARTVWDMINGPNLHEHIAPTRKEAEVVVRLASDHAVVAIDIVAPRVEGQVTDLSEVIAGP